MINFYRLLAIFAILLSASLGAEIKGSIDISPTFVKIDILESGKTVDTVKMLALRGDSTLLLYKGFCLKPSFMVGGSRHGGIATGGLGIGHYTPLHERFTLIPSVGVSLGYLWTRVDFKDFYMNDLKERFRSVSPYIGMELYVKLSEKWYTSLIYQYAWSTTHTKISHLFSSKGHSEGSNYGLTLEYSLSKCCSIVGGLGYNLSLSKEKHGIRAKGAKLGIAYYF